MCSVYANHVMIPFNRRGLRRKRRTRRKRKKNENCMHSNINDLAKATLHTYLCVDHLFDHSFACRVPPSAYRRWDEEAFDTRRKVCVRVENVFVCAAECIPTDTQRYAMRITTATYLDHKSRQQR